MSEKQSEEVAARPAAEAPPQPILIRRPLWLVLTLFVALFAVGWLAKDADPEKARAWLLSEEHVLTRLPAAREIGWALTIPWRWLILLCGVAATMVAVRCRKLHRVEAWLSQGLLGPANPPALAPALSRGRWAWPLFGAAIFVAAMVIVEVQQPYYFSQDDCFAENLPYMLQGCRSVFSGDFPEWNPYQLMGSPAATTGYHSLLYPPVYLAYFLATYVLGNEYLLAEIYVIGHFAAGLCITYWAARKAGIRPSLSTLGSLCFVLSGYSLIIGRSWPDMDPIVVWMPLLIISLLELEQRPVGWKWAALTGLAIGLFFLVGFSQNWIYAMLCFGAGAALLVLTGRAAWQRALWLVPAGLFGLAVCAPLLFVQVHWVRDLARVAPYGSNIEPGLIAMLLPYPFHAPFPDAEWGNHYREYAGQLYYSGTLFCLVSFLAWGALIAYRWNWELLRRNVWLLCAAMAFLLALGRMGALWQLLTYLPLVGKSNDHPVRALPFFNLFAVLAGGLIIERLLQGLRRPRVCELLLAVGVGGLLLYHVLLARTALYLYGDCPYPPMPAQMAELFHPADVTELRRSISISRPRSSEKGHCLSLPGGFPSVYSVLSMDAYDPAVETKPQGEAMRKRLYRNPVKAAQAYGVRWLLVQGVGPLVQQACDSGLHGQALWNSVKKKITNHLNEAPCPTERSLNNRGAEVLIPLYLASEPMLNLPEINLVVRKLPGAMPMAFAEDGPGKALPVHFSAAGADVDLSGRPEGGAIIVNILFWPRLTASADGKPLSLARDAWGRVRVRVPPRSAKLEIRYRGPWGAGICLAGGLALAGVLAGVALCFFFPGPSRARAP